MESHHQYIIYSLPLIAALLGWFTNMIAVKMLFRPRNKVKILFFELQGIFPKRQEVLAAKIGKIVAEQLFSVDDIKEKIRAPENLAEVYEKVDQSVEDYLNTRFPENFPIISMLVGKKRKAAIREEFSREVKTIAPDVLEHYVDKLEHSIDVESIIRENVSILSPVMLENLILKILKKEFRFIELIGALIGFLIGMIQLMLMKL